MSLSPSPRASTAVPLLGGMSSGHHCTWESGGLDASRSPTNSTAMSDLLVMGPVVESPRSQCPLSPGTLLAERRQERRVSFQVKQPKLVTGSQHPAIPL